MNAPENFEFAKLRQCVSFPGLFFLFVVLGSCYLVAGKDWAVAVGCGTAIGIIAAAIGLVWKRSEKYQLSIRGILAFTAVVAVCAVSQQHWFLNSEAAISRIENLGGEAFVREAPGVESESSAQFIRQDILPRHLNYLRSLPNLTHLDLDYTRVGNPGMSYVGKLTQLVWLDVEDTGITDEGLRKLRSLQSLERIIVDGNDVTDAGLMHLAQLKSLKNVRLLNTNVTDAGVQRFNAELPGCSIRVR